MKKSWFYTICFCLFSQCLLGQKTLDKIISKRISSLNGKSYEKKDLKGKVIVLNLWATWCVPCQKEIPDLNNLLKHYKEKPDVIFFAIACSEKDNQETVGNFLKNVPFLFQHILPDTELGYLTERDKLRYPTTVVFDRNGIIQKKYVGVLQKRELAQIRDIIEGN